MKMICVIMLLWPWASFARRGGGDGSGGGPGSLIESAFRIHATSLINQIRLNPQAQALCSAQTLTLALTSSDVKAVRHLVDPFTRLEVHDQDSWTVAGKIQLLKSAWAGITEQVESPRLGHKYDALVLHELYRATRGICLDDRFVLTDRVYLILTSPLPIVETLTLSGVSAWASSLGQGTNESLDVYGGLGGSPCPSSRGSTCNSCAPKVTKSCVDSLGQDHFPLCACNESRIQDQTLLTITMQEGVDRGSLHFSATMPTSAGGAVDLPGSSSQEKTVSVPWQSICASAGPNTCEGLGTTELLFYLWSSTDRVVPVHVHIVSPSVDESVYGAPLAEALGQFTPFPGDERIYLTNVSTAVVFPSLAAEGSQVGGLKILASQESMDRATPALAEASGTTLVSGTSFVSQYIEGLENGRSYFVRTAAIDLANNLVQFYPDKVSLPEACSGTHADAGKCPFAVKLKPQNMMR